MIFRWGVLVVCSLLMACGGQAEEGPRLIEKNAAPAKVEKQVYSALGESCTKTADCVLGLRCVSLVCVSPASASQATESAPKAVEVKEAPPETETEVVVAEVAEEVKEEVETEGDSVGKVDPKKVGLQDLLSTNKLGGVGAIANIMQNSQSGMTNKLAVAMAGTGTEFEIGHGAGGLGLYGTGTGGGGTGGAGRIGGTGKFDTGGGMGVGGLGGKKKRRVAKMRLGGMGARGFCKKGDISSKVRRRAAAIRACYEKVLMRKPGLSGKVMVKWQIGLDGRVAGLVSTSGSMPDGSVKACVGRMIQRIRFAKPEGGICIVKWPFVFTKG